MASTEERRFEVLRAIVADYVSTQEPIGSKALVERHNLGVSSATIRNDMAALEAEGYITQPHTSSGRYRPTRATASSSTGSPTSSRSRRLSAARSSSFSSPVSTWTTSFGAGCGCSRSSPAGRRRAVPHAVGIVGASPRGGGPHAGAPTDGADHRLRTRRPANRRTRRRDRRRGPVPAGALLGGALEGKRLAAASIAVSELAEDAPENLRDAVIRSATVLVETLVETPRGSPGPGWDREPDTQRGRFHHAGGAARLTAFRARGARGAGGGPQADRGDAGRRPGHRAYR